MASARDKRRFAFQALYQLDARGPHAAEQIKAWLGESKDLGAEERDEVYHLALMAYEKRREADAEFASLAPTWPAHRQPAVDRALLRLAHYEMSQPGGPEKGKVIMNDVIELVREYSTDRSPSFVNGLLDKVYKRLTGQPVASGEPVVTDGALPPTADDATATPPC